MQKTNAVIEKKDDKDEDYDLSDDFEDDEVQEELPQTDEEEKENITIQDYEKYDPNLFKTDVQKKF
ncbi:hypothetical protein J5751_05385 [bacterium]|nr:hypothetical protein [bacterium]